jgi:hypothetical protein
MALAVSREGQLSLLLLREAGYCTCGDTGCTCGDTGYRFSRGGKPGHEAPRHTFAGAVASVHRQPVLGCVRCLPVEPATRAQVDEAFLDQLSESPCGSVLRAAHTFSSGPGREHKSPVIAAVVEARQFDIDTYCDRRERAPRGRAQHVVRQSHEAFCRVPAFGIVTFSHELPTAALRGSRTSIV